MFNLNDKVTSYSSQCIGIIIESVTYTCLLYTSDAADEL